MFITCETRWSEDTIINTDNVCQVYYDHDRTVVVVYNDDHELFLSRQSSQKVYSTISNLPNFVKMRSYHGWALINLKLVSDIKEIIPNANYGYNIAISYPKTIIGKSKICLTIDTLFCGITYEELVSKVEKLN